MANQRNEIIIRGSVLKFTSTTGKDRVKYDPNYAGYLIAMRGDKIKAMQKKAAASYQTY